MEIWKTIPSFSNYEVSNLGRIRNKKTGGFIKGSATRKGYLRTRLRNDQGEHKNLNFHRLVLLAFVGPLPGGMVTRHLDGNQSNNRLSNLKYGTQSENSMDSVKHGTNPNQKLDAEDVKDIRRKYATGEYTQREIAKTFGVTPGSVSLIVRRKGWKHVK
jgi:hypothetical protein